MNKHVFASLFAIVFLFGCTEDIDLKVLGGDIKIVIEGKIESGQFPQVDVLRSNPLGATRDFIEFAFVTDAIITVSDGTTTEQLSGSFDSSYTYFGTYKGSSIIGVPGKTYTLRVEARPDPDSDKTQVYTATTTIPAVVALDSVWWEPPSGASNDTLGFAWAHLSEPAGAGNAYRWYAKRAKRYYEEDQTADRRYLSPYGATFDDRFIDGKSLDLNFARGLDPSDAFTIKEAQSGSQDGFFTFFDESDIIYIKFCTLDYNSYQFYTTYEAAAQSNGNPFASPVNIFSNIDNGGLGVWAGFGVSYDTIYPKPYWIWSKIENGPLYAPVSGRQ